MSLPGTLGWCGSIRARRRGGPGRLHLGRLRAWQSGAAFAVHWQRAGSPVHYEPDREDELTLVGPAGAVRGSGAAPAGWP